MAAQAACISSCCPRWSLTLTGRSWRASSGASRAPCAASPSAARSALRPSPSRAPTAADGEPFPTTYYLTCRHLVAAVSRLEAAGGVERWSEATRDDAALAASLAAGDEEQRSLRRELAGDVTGSDGGASLDYGIGGSRRSGSLKCLHAHVAFALARPGYELGERILAEVEPRWPERCCSQ